MDEEGLGVRSFVLQHCRQAFEMNMYKNPHYRHLSVFWANRAAGSLNTLMRLFAQVCCVIFPGFFKDK